MFRFTPLSSRSSIAYAFASSWGSSTPYTRRNNELEALYEGTSMIKRLGLFTLALAFSGVALAQSSQAIRDQLFGPTDALKQSADAVHAKMLGPQAYAEAMELYKDAGDTLAKGKDVNSVKEDLTKA